MGTRDKQYLDMMNQWLILNHEGKNIQSYLYKKGYHSVAIYGMALYGRHVIRELKETGICIAYGIDQRKIKPYKGIEVFQPTGMLPHADVIINTVIHDHKNIQKALRLITDMSVLSLEDIIFESYD